MSCEKKKICNICEAPFRMKIGCYLEKRCPACRMLELQRMKKYPFKIVRQKILSEQSVGKKTIQYYDETQVLKWIFEDSPSLEPHEDPMFEMAFKDEVSNRVYEVINDSDLNERERTAVVLDYIQEYSYKEIGNVLGVTSERARQISFSGIKKLKHPKNARKFIK